MFTTRRQYNPLFFCLKDVEIGLFTTLMYLGLWFEGCSDSMSTRGKHKAVKMARTRREEKQVR